MKSRFSLRFVTAEDSIIDRPINEVRYKSIYSESENMQCNFTFVFVIKNKQDTLWLNCENLGLDVLWCFEKVRSEILLCEGVRL